MRWLLTRSFAVLGGSIAGTAVAWAIASGSAAAEPVLDDLGLDSHAARAVDVVEETAGRVADVLPGKQKAVDAVRASRPLQVPLAHRTPSLGLPQATQAQLPAVLPEQSEQNTVAQALNAAGADDVGNEVAATIEAPDPDGASRARSPRTASGNGPLGGTGGAPIAHAPASVPPAPVNPAAAASGCSAGSSLLPALVGQYPAGDAFAGVPAVVASAAECGRTNTAGEQPGTSPD